MNQMRSPSELASLQQKKKLGSWLRNWFATRVIETVSVSLAISLALFGFSGWTIWNIYQGFRDTVTKQFRLQELGEETIYYDEALTASANMAVSTGDLKWLDRYDSFATKLDATIAELVQSSPQAAADFDQAKGATDKLYALEGKTFELLRQGKQAQANAILFGSEYAKQKEIYSQGVDRTLKNLKASVENQLQSYSQKLFGAVVFAAISVPLLVLVWVLILAAIRTYVRERNRAQQDLLNSQNSLRQLNEELEEKVEQRTQQLAAQEQATREESEILQADVENLLDVVSAVEEGNLNVEAPVSDRVTGLVADTFNRLVEELAKVLSQVVRASRQISESASSLEQIASTVSIDANRQAESVERASSLSERVELVAQETTQQIRLSNESLTILAQTVRDGQKAMGSLTQATEVLRQGTERIVQQMKTLGEFVGLAEQFVQDQGQLASETQVLALNAALVAARAAEQQNPLQFAVAAKEFEAIADRVSKLAEQTNTGLSVLEQRITQIQNVVATVDSEIQNLGGLVVGFSQGVERSTEVFDSVRSVTADTVKVGETITRSSQEIIDAVRSSATTMRGVAELAQRTAKLTQKARTQSETMGQLSTQLLQRVEFFRLPTAVLAGEQESEPVNLERSEEKTIDIAVTK
jgi:twitching motility protein PilJ